MDDDVLGLGLDDDEDDVEADDARVMQAGRAGGGGTVTSEAGWQVQQDLGKRREGDSEDDKDGAGGGGTVTMATLAVEVRW